MTEPAPASGRAHEHLAPIARPDGAGLPVTRPTPSPVVGAPGPMAGLRVVELAHPFGAFAGKLLADAGADVVVVEPPDGAEQRRHGPFAEGVAGPERSLAWWAENTSKRSVTCDWANSADERRRLGTLIDRADVLIECAEPGSLDALGLGYDRLSDRNPTLIHVAITPFGQAGIGGGTDVTDLTLLARGGPMWSCGYDDHDLPPVRGRGNQGIRIAAHHAVMGVLTALLARARCGGQFVDVSMHAAANVTTEFASYGWLSGQSTVQRQTGRHATPEPTESTQVQCADGRFLNTGVPPRSGREFRSLMDWIDELGLRESFELSTVLELGFDYELITLAMLQEDPLAGEVFGAGREAMAAIAASVSAHEAFLGFQQRGIACGVVWSPDEVMSDPHFVERGFPTPVYQDVLGREVLYPGPPIRFTRSPMAIHHPAPRVGQHNEQVWREVDLAPAAG